MPRVPPGTPRRLPWLWALPAGALLFAGLGAVAGGLIEVNLTTSVWEDIAARNHENWRAFGRVAAVVWGYYGLFAGAGFALGSMGIDDAMPSMQRYRIGVAAVLLAPFGRLALEWIGAQAFLGRDLTPNDLTSALASGLMIPAVAMVLGGTLPSVFEPKNTDFDGNLSPFGSGADFRRMDYNIGVLLLGGLFFLSLVGLLLIL